MVLSELLLGCADRQTPIEDRPPRRVSPGSVPRRAKKRLSEITGATEGDVGSGKKPRRSRKKVPNYGDSTPKRVPFTPLECKYLIAGVEKYVCLKLGMHRIYGRKISLLKAC